MNKVESREISHFFLSLTPHISTGYVSRRLIPNIYLFACIYIYFCINGIWLYIWFLQLIELFSSCAFCLFHFILLLSFLFLLIILLILVWIEDCLRMGSSMEFSGGVAFWLQYGSNVVCSHGHNLKHHWTPGKDADHPGRGSGWWVPLIAVWLTVWKLLITVLLTKVSSSNAHSCFLSLPSGFIFSFSRLIVRKQILGWDTEDSLTWCQRNLPSAWALETHWLCLSSVEFHWFCLGVVDTPFFLLWMH